MSVKVMGMVFERYPNGGGEMILALALADHSSDQGTGIYPSIASLAEKTRQSVRAVQYQLRGMEKAGWLILVNAGNGGRNQRREYRISEAWIKGADFASLKPAAPEQENGADFAPPEAAEKGANHDTKGAIDDVKGANGDTKGCNGLHPHITVIEPSEPSRTVTGARKRSPGFDPMCVELPDWLDAELWARWARHRAQLRKPLTEEAARQQVKDLANFRQQGHTPEAVIEHAIGKSWQGLFAPSGTASGGAPRPGKFNPTDYVNRNRTSGGPDYDDGRTIDA
ncbi:helix-turn-helix domain-containing protein [Achromobacter denitrificans]|uniref:helix-turn-helix domain-containing protein n=1 Tax=Achromobacter denitrificans TaxID=32002 RepID=UPI00242DAEB2|nr:helix-turn-helix domain-containing protein [Achromobacter denitrificans]MBV2160230.1 helix-turn-helix domain-containing protein [Achromobacter denitrificans]